MSTDPADAGPPPLDPLDTLTVAELDAGSRLLHTDLVHAITTPGSEHRWSALAVVAYLRDRRDDPAADVARYRRMTANELGRALGLDRTPHPDPGAGSSDPGAGSSDPGAGSSDPGAGGGQTGGGQTGGGQGGGVDVGGPVPPPPPSLEGVAAELTADPTVRGRA